MSRPGVRSPTAPKFILQMFKRCLKLDFTKKIPLVVLVCAACLFPAENIVNFSSAITVSDFLAVGDTLWAASSGGLAAHDLGRGGKALISNAKIFPDPYLTALCRDSRGNLWIGSRRGYLYRKTPQGQFAVFPSYKYSEWGITCLFAYGELLVVGSDRGVSLFDPERGVAVRNATGISTFSNPRVNAISAFGNTLFLGCDEGVAYLDSLDVVPLLQRNFYYPGIWKKKAGHSGPAASFVNTGSSVEADSLPSAMFRGYKFTADSGKVAYVDDRGRSTQFTVVPLVRDGRGNIIAGRILKLYNENDNRLWIGTDERYYYSYDGESVPEQHRIEGLALRSGSRTMTAQNGDVWVLPVALSPNSWYHGIYRYDGRGWHPYDFRTYDERFGYFGDDRALGAAFGRDGTLWAGTWGGNIKHIGPAPNNFGQLIVGNGDFGNIGYYGDVSLPEELRGMWGKVDALAMDSSGYLWASIWRHNFGGLICYDPRYPAAYWEPNPVKAHYRWFFTEPPLKADNITELCVDADNRIFAYDDVERLTLFRHGGSPFADSIKVDTVYSSLGRMAAIKAAPDGGAYIVGTRGLMKISARSLKVDFIDSTLTNATSMSVQGNILWFGTATNGVLRYDIDKKEKKLIGEADGLPSDNVWSVAADDKKGHLWIVSEGVVSRLDIGSVAKPAPKEAVKVFPNVFSISGRMQGAQQVTFARLDPRSTVSVYAVNGTLVAKVSSEYFTESEWRAAWTPKPTLAPGTYIAVIKPSGKKAKILLKP